MDQNLQLNSFLSPAIGIETQCSQLTVPPGWWEGFLSHISRVMSPPLASHTGDSSFDAFSRTKAAQGTPTATVTCGNLEANSRRGVQHRSRPLCGQHCGSVARKNKGQEEKRRRDRGGEERGREEGTRRQQWLSSSMAFGGRKPPLVLRGRLWQAICTEGR